jgi:DNA-binding MarR family transcriptional regulator
MTANPQNLHQPEDSLTEMQDALRRVLRSLIFFGSPPGALAELPLSQLRCWYCIAEHEGFKMQDLSNVLEIKLPALSQIVERLVKRGLVKRRPDPQDRRVVRLHLTETARAIHQEGKASQRERIASTSARLAPRTFQQIVKGLNVLAEAAEKVEAGARQSCSGSRNAEDMAELIVKQIDSDRKNISPNLSPVAAKRGQTLRKGAPAPVASVVRRGA